MNQEEARVRDELAALYRLVAHFRMTDLIDTHISARVPGDKPHFLINRYGVLFHEMRPQDLVKIDLEQCEACGECAEACPFGAIVIGPDGLSLKCDGCADELAQGWRPTCVRSCPMRALWFGPPDEVPFENRVPDPEFDDHGIGPAVAYLCRKKSRE